MIDKPANQEHSLLGYSLLLLFIMVEEVLKDTLNAKFRLYSLLIFKFSFFKPVNNE